MAKKIKKQKGEPGRLGQILQVAKMTCADSPKAIWFLILAAAVPLVAGIILSIVLSGGSWLMLILLLLITVLATFVSVMITLSRMAEGMAYRQIEGQPGAAGAVIRMLRGYWQTSEMPVAVNPKTTDAIYRAVGRPGVVLIVEGMRQRAQKMLTEEQRRIRRILPNVPIHVLNINIEDAQALPLRNLPKAMKKLKKTLRPVEVRQVAGRLDSLPRNALPIPKGMDIQKLKRPPRR